MAGRRKPLVRSERYKGPMCLRNIRRVIQRQLMGKCGSGQTSGQRGKEWMWEWGSEGALGGSGSNHRGAWSLQRTLELL